MRVNTPVRPQLFYPVGVIHYNKQVLRLLATATPVLCTISPYQPVQRVAPLYIPKIYRTFVVPQTSNILILWQTPTTKFTSNLLYA